MAVPRWIMEMPDHLKTQDICNEAMCINPLSLPHVPDHLQTQELCDAAVRENPCEFEFVPDHFKTQEKCIEKVKADQSNLFNTPVHSLASIKMAGLVCFRRRKKGDRKIVEVTESCF